MNLEIESYEWEEIHKILGKINNQIEAFRKMYHKKPTFIIISKKLECILKNQMGLMCQNEMIILNGEELRLNRIFGFSCFSSPSLNNLDFEIR
jgi:hypothetical protein